MATQNQEQSPISDIFTELANEVRCNILTDLQGTKHSPIEISSKENLPIQEIHRQLNRLVEVGFVKKASDSSFSLTSNGKIAISQIPFFQFMNNYKEFFSSHNTGDLSDDLIMRFGVLQNSKLVKGIGTVIENYKKIVTESSQSLRVTLPQVVTDANKTVLKRAKDGMKVYYIYGENTIVPQENIDLEKKVGIKKLISQGTVQKRKIPHVGITVAITDHHAMIFFPDSSGDSDINCVFQSDDELFREWCIDYFNGKWNEGVPINE